MSAWLAGMARDVLYDDGGTVLDRVGIVLRRYYFPVPFAKRIPYTAIRSVEARGMTFFTGQGRIWGTGSFGSWLPLDPSRPRKETLLLLDLGRRVRPAFSPDRPDEVLAILHAHVPGV